MNYNLTDLKSPEYFWVSFSQWCDKLIVHQKHYRNHNISKTNIISSSYKAIAINLEITGSAVDAVLVTRDFSVIKRRRKGADRNWRLWRKSWMRTNSRKLKLYEKAQKYKTIIVKYFIDYQQSFWDDVIAKKIQYYYYCAVVHGFFSVRLVFCPQSKVTHVGWINDFNHMTQRKKCL